MFEIVSYKQLLAKPLQPLCLRFESSLLLQHFQNLIGVVWFFALNAPRSFRFCFKIKAILASQASLLEKVKIQ